MITGCALLWAATMLSSRSGDRKRDLIPLEVMWPIQIDRFSIWLSNGVQIRRAGTRSKDQRPNAPNC